MTENAQATAQKATEVNQDVMKDVNKQVGQAINSALGAADDATEPAAGTEPVAGAAGAGGAVPATVAPVAAATEPPLTREGKIHRMNAKIKGFFNKIFKKKEPAATATTEPAAPTTATQEVNTVTPPAL